MPQRKYRHLFFDLDHTLWDFDANARATLQQLHLDLKLPERGIADFDAFYDTYIAHNDKLWERYRKGYIRQEELRLKRMWLTLLDFKIADEALSRQLSELFLQLLPTRTLIFPDTKEVLTCLQEKGYGMHMITNGFEQIQHAKLRVSGLDTFFQHIVTSEGSNSLKPQPEIYHYALEKAGATAADSLMIGDSLEVDIAGARGVGMDGVHVNFNGAAQAFAPTYTVTALKQLLAFL
ncbi:YjjG family noncanonical pyrimidine nucleotidase [Flaviaesturariibacter aridisoli]|uniref:Noncanonical pyrimidine nucleotidase, YjjG family n=1 Tax=Flaviaesturariibacter aridisoli TaxID=2545761 RepID=A0A4R4E4R9_9BACT|nr:YjjG family noncanonical pyrimidine nucleotidase [Flaviaesturariibacter aridisoli]TCZ72220.1 noncanonical pyrimidine nucleotidase, YjjG family [Flaviaesturariibacter aridisoli]